MLEAAGRVAMVSGAARGIGRAVVQRLLAAGFQVSAGLRDPRRLDPAPGLALHAYEAEDIASATAWVAATAARFGRIDALVNAAGINSKARLLDEDEAALDSLWRVNVKGPMRLLRLAWPHLIAGGEGRVVNIASLSGKRVRNENVGYAMSKHAVLALTHAARREGWEHGLRATALCPGFVDTDMTAHVTKLPRDHMSRPEDIAVLVETLLRLPNTASVAELLVNCQREEML
ncbi:SDR family NAD(P)-dependent oxidoreductase [Paracraurococcus lichenis]|uniref:SDR family NAD(P)-dependent oxidoreductase n=1 Tax=Paracraurococcus lichenis TaxID=3064888 RepID=A0ABT9E5Z9_9PROT|nr:SDR family NAD(P)-dependent oxidoreductase [Paracraurococcus sp. LOR1-02]MDO9711596.1 SDR family NAD(P)-dependent oxidoreductase [Paracraurococcus sp. LOR1-02]